MIRVSQLADTHFSTAPTERGGYGRADARDAFDAVLKTMAAEAPHPDLVVVTGDIADRGQPSEYQLAADAFATFPASVAVLPGSTDFRVPFEAVLPRDAIAAPRTMRLGPWLFVFVDSNGLGQVRDRTGRLVDLPERSQTSGRLGASELAWLDDTLTVTDAEHAFLWMHAAPGLPAGLANDPLTYELDRLMARHPIIRGIGCGGAHTSTVAEVAHRPVFCCPSLVDNVDIENFTTLPPGFRTFEFLPNGAVGSTVYLLNDSRWPVEALDAAAQARVTTAVASNATIDLTNASEPARPDSPLFPT